MRAQSDASHSLLWSPMKQLITAERFCLVAHFLTMVFGLVGLLLVLPNLGSVLTLATTIQPGLATTIQYLFQWSMSGGGVANILLGTAAVAIHAYRTLGLGNLLGFMIPAVSLSLGSELLSTSTGFPFGHYAYLNGLGYKVAGLVPFTIPLSWFYIGLSAYLLAGSGLSARLSRPSGTRWGMRVGAILLGALLLTSWDFVLDPAMSQTAAPFWEWKQPGAFFGMPYQNFGGWLGTGTLFMSIAALLWGKSPKSLTRSELGLPLAVYGGNFAYATVISLAGGISIPVLLGMALGLVPALILWQMTPEALPNQFRLEAGQGIEAFSLEALPK